MCLLCQLHDAMGVTYRQAVAICNMLRRPPMRDTAQNQCGYDTELVNSPHWHALRVETLISIETSSIHYAVARLAFTGAFCCQVALCFVYFVDHWFLDASTLRPSFIRSYRGSILCLSFTCPGQHVFLFRFLVLSGAHIERTWVS